MARYRKIDPRIWNDAKFRQLSDDGQLAFIFVLTHPFMTSVGAMRATSPGLAAEKRWPADRMAAALDECAELGLVEIDHDAAFVAAPHFLRYNEPEGPNSVGAWAESIDLVPECDLKKRVYARACQYLATKGVGFLDALARQVALPAASIREASGDAISDAIRHAIDRACHIPEPDPEPEPEKRGTRARPRDPGAAAPEPPAPSSPTAAEPKAKDRHPVLAEWAEEATTVGAKAPIDDRTDQPMAEAIAAAEPDPGRRRAVFREAHRAGKALRFVREEWPKLEKAAQKTAANERKKAETERQAEESRKRFEGSPAPPVAVDSLELTEKGRQFQEQRQRVKARRAGTLESPKQTADEAIASLNRSESA